MKFSENFTLFLNGEQVNEVDINTVDTIYKIDGDKIYFTSSNSFPAEKVYPSFLDEVLVWNSSVTSSAEICKDTHWSREKSKKVEEPKVVHSNPFEPFCSKKEIIENQENNSPLKNNKEYNGLKECLGGQMKRGKIFEYKPYDNKEDIEARIIAQWENKTIKQENQINKCEYGNRVNLEDVSIPMNSTGSDRMKITMSPEIKRNSVGNHTINLSTLKLNTPYMETSEGDKTGIKETNGKTDYSEINLEILDLMAERFTANKHKYPKNNMKKAVDVKGLEWALFRHLKKMIQPLEEDDETYKEHLAAILCNASMILDQLNLESSK